MHLVLTHEQADFDAVAACLGVHLLDREAQPVLPHRVNRNVRAFLTLYGEKLPFRSFDDLNSSSVDQVTLVDTQNLPSLKGAHEGTRVHVVDHHDLGPGVESDWTSHIEDVGAATTLLVQDLREGGVELNLVQATLLLLGIYEDTGSLTYSGTTSLDLLACAWLLEAGASLTLANDFLNQPLSNEQRDLYERLLEQTETHEFKGLNVLLASGAVDGMVDEISPLAHKLRDVFDPAGLFLLVEMNENVQLVARSTSDSVDVSRVAEHFGGGGHPRAAAALVREQGVKQVRQELLELLPQVIEAPTTVGQLMSRGPQLLSPEAEIREAADRMHRTGHEGYPVVDGDEVVGLLTRRAVDRAMTHGLGGRPVSSVMEAGDVTVQPDDSVQHLQQVMIRNDWGQVPVRDPEGGRIIGIVTRTDLLRTLADAGPRPGEVNLADELEAALPPLRLNLLRRIADAAERQGVALYIVGGFVRDLLLRSPSVDFDLVTEGDAIELAHSLAKSYGGSVNSHRRFGTAKWRIDTDSKRLRNDLEIEGADLSSLPHSVDLVSARSEFYDHPTALPTVERGSIKLDLHRRDFTINTLALRLDGPYYGQLLDHWGGGEDLEQGVIRVLHSLSFVDDPTRMLRAVRLEQRLDFAIEQRTMELLEDARGLLDRVSGDRIRSELELIFRESALSAIMARLHELDLLQAIHPALTWDDWLQARWRAAREFDLPQDWKLARGPELEELYLALWSFRLAPRQAESICERLRIPGSEQELILGANRTGAKLAQADASAPASELASLLDGAPLQALPVLWLAIDSESGHQAIDRYLTQWIEVKPHADGDTLREKGLIPGPIYGEILGKLRDAWLDGEVSSEQEEMALLDQLLEEYEDSG